MSLVASIQLDHFFIHSANFCVVIGMFNPFTFNVFTDKVRFIPAISLFIFHMSYVFLFFYSSTAAFFVLKDIF